MSAELTLFTQSWRVGRYTCVLTVPQIQPGRPLAAVLEWSPDVPGKLTRKQRREYKAGRDRAFVELAAAHGISVAVVDL